jgi:hypothetical protein
LEQNKGNNNGQQLSPETMLEWTGAAHMQLIIQHTYAQKQLAQAMAEIKQLRIKIAELEKKDGNNMY